MLVSIISFRQSCKALCGHYFLGASTFFWLVIWFLVEMYIWVFVGFLSEFSFPKFFSYAFLCILIICPGHCFLCYYHLKITSSLIVSLAWSCTFHYQPSSEVIVSSSFIYLSYPNKLVSQWNIFIFIY